MDWVACLRDALRCATRALHDSLDLALSPLASGIGYPRFLALQYAARTPIERWFAGSGSSLALPVQTPLIFADMVELRAAKPALATDFQPADQREDIGIAWALAGSSLGNKLMLKRRKDFDGGVATRFLADGAMLQFWMELLPRLEAPADAQATELAVAGATRVFDHFLAVAQADERRLAA